MLVQRYWRFFSNHQRQI